MVKIFVAGDIVNYHNESGLLCTDTLSSLIQDSDYSVCNFEAPITGYGKKERKCGPHLNQSAITVHGLKQQGFDLLLLANNHILDYGTDGLTGTMNLAKEHGLDTTGAGLSKSEAYSPLIKNIKGLRIGIINACEAQFGVISHFEKANTAGYAWINHTLIDKNVLHLRNQCDFVLVFVHAGLENYNIPQIEWRDRYRHLCDLGADIVIGTHPHVPQGYECHNGSLIFYSLGNFYFDYGYARHSENCSYAIRIELNKGETPTFEPIFHHTNNGKVDVSPINKRVNITDLCHQLGDGYEKAHDLMSLETYHMIKKLLIRSMSTIPTDGTITGTVREILATLLFRRKAFDKSLYSLHFLRNEAYYYATRHALELESREK